MTDPSPDRDTPVGSDPAPTTGTPRWVKVFAVITLVAVVLFLIVLLIGGPGRHGPSRHDPGRHTGGLGYAPTTSITAHGVPLR